MEFFIKIDLSPLKNIEIRKISDLTNNLITNSIFLPEPNATQSIDTFGSGSTKYFVIGDPIYHEDKKLIQESLINNRDIGSFIRNTDGFYYLICYSENEGKLMVSSSMFNILPVFYGTHSNSLYISSSLTHLLKHTSIEREIDEMYYLEKTVFNYPFLNRTPVKSIKTIPSNTILSFCEGNYEFLKHTSVSDYFSSNPLPLKESSDHLAEQFSNSLNVFFPDDKFCATLTGGLDGRTIVSGALKSKKNFYTYSYGSLESADVLIPKEISKITGIPHVTLQLDNSFSGKYFWEYGNSFIQRSFGLGNLSRAHYAYAAQNLFKDTNCLLSGNFGSEIIRSMKVVGVMTSEILFLIFQNKSRQEIIEGIKNYYPVKYLTSDKLNALIEQLVTEITQYLNNLPRNLSDNQRFYIYMFEEVFPKYFGPEIMNQREFVRHRAPFLSFKFIQELLKTEAAGANSDFMETNPFKRYKGQVLYSKIMAKLDQRLLNVKLDKGYKPVRFLELIGPIRIMIAYYLKKLGKNEVQSNSYQNKKEVLKHCATEKLDNKYFDMKSLLKDLEASSEKDISHFYNIISSSIYINSIEKNLS